jgi:hypothetical protein
MPGFKQWHKNYVQRGYKSAFGRRRILQSPGLKNQRPGQKNGRPKAPAPKLSKRKSFDIKRKDRKADGRRHGES